MTSTAVNQLEMWMAETFDADLIEKEVELDGRLGFNTMKIE
jgi:hypothetical protein